MDLKVFSPLSNYFLGCGDHAQEEITLSLALEADKAMVRAGPISA